MPTELGKATSTAGLDPLQAKGPDHGSNLLHAFFVGSQLGAEVSDVLIRVARRPVAAAESLPQVGLLKAAA